MRKIKTLLILGVCLLGSIVSAQIPTGFSLSNFSSGYSLPVNIANAGDSRLFIVQQRGAIYICDSVGTRLTTPFLNISSKVSSSGSERGLLGLAFDPNYDLNGYFYVNYTRSSDHSTVIARYTRDFSNANLADPASEKVLLTIDQPFSNHNGGHLAFGRDGYLYIGMGDGGSAGDPGGRGQNPGTLLGKMLRIDVSVPDSTYLIPASNPFVGSPSTLEEIWAIGMRNPWKFSIDRLTGDLWIGDVGQDAWEEVDFEAYGDPGGRNYGWRCYEGNNPYILSGCGAGPFTYPVSVYANTAGMGCSITGGIRYRGGRYASMYATYLYSDYCTGKFWAVYDSLGSGVWKTEEFADVSDAINPVAFGENHLGELFVAGIGTGRIYRITDTACAVTAQVITPDSGLVCSDSYVEALGCEGCTYQWFLDGSAIAGANSWKVAPASSGSYHIVVTGPGGCADTSSSVYVNFSTAPVVDFTGLDASYCDFDPIDTLVGTPAGGTFWGTGIFGGNLLDPAVPPAFAGEGTHAITYTYTDSVGCTVTVAHVAAFTTCVGLEHSAAHWDLSVSPNPTRGQVEVRCTDLLGKTVQMDLMSPNGQVLKTWQQTFSVVAVPVDLREYPAGVYLLRVTLGNEKRQMRIVVQ